MTVEKKIIVALSIAFLISLAALITVAASGSRYPELDGSRVSPIILDKTMAIDMGRVVLTSHYPDLSDNGDIAFDAEKSGGHWIVRSVPNLPADQTNPSKVVTAGGAYEVELQASTGAVIAVRVQD